jgi:uncharacterized protein (DUF433 family)
MTIQYPELWKERLHIPAYNVRDAARYAGTSVQTVGNWQKLRGASRAISHREQGEGLSYAQLIELGVVAAMRKEGVPLKAIRDARAYLGTEFGSVNPFAEYRFKTDGKQLVLDSETLDPSVRGKLIVVSESGQYAWKEILARLLRQFEYSPDDEGVVVRWHVAGDDSPVVIDPRICFGAPHVNGVPTWILKERWNSGEGLKDIADDFNLGAAKVSAALRFEGVEVDPDRPNQWVH